MKGKELTMADIVRCPCGSNVVRKYPGQSRCANCEAAGAKEPGPRTETSLLKIFVPPSLYDLWEPQGDGGKKRSPIYQAWIDQHLNDVIEAFWWPTPPIGVMLTIHGGEGFTESRDLDNCYKAVQDILQLAGVVESDSVKHIVEGGFKFIPGSKSAPAYATIRIVEVRR